MDEAESEAAVEMLVREEVVVGDSFMHDEEDLVGGDGEPEEVGDGDDRREEEEQHGQQQEGQLGLDHLVAGQVDNHE